jgi:DNA modification methylase
MRIERIAIDKIRPAPYNPRVDLKPGDPEYEKLARSIAEFDMVEPLVWNKRTGNLVGGHQRLKILKAKGEKEVEVSVVDMDPNREKALNIALNKISGDWDTVALDELLSELKGDGFDVSLTGFDDKQLSALAREADELKKSEIYEDDVPLLPRKPITKRGDLIILGSHRLLCGDSTNAKDVARVMDGAKADLLVTDPPYGVSYVGKTKDALTIENDNKDDAELSVLVKAVFNNAQEFCRGGAYWYATVPAGPLHLIFASDWKNRGILRQIMVWAKDSMVLGHSEYHYQHEPILFGWMEGERYKNADRTRTTLWTYDRPKRSTEHPTMKPVELWAQMMRDGSLRGDIVFDPFLGSGTTIIAAESLSRKCYGLELSPGYCDVIVERWEKFTGKKADRQEAVKV